MRILLALLVFLSSIPLIGQTNLDIDTAFLTTTEKTTFFNKAVSLGDPNKAALLSALVPGLGQVYNNQAWKVPFIYAGGIVLLHYIRYNHEIYQTFRTALIAENDKLGSATPNPFNQVEPGRYNAATMQVRLEYFRRNRDYLMIITSVFYLLNIAEAHIAAHLKEFDLNENYSLSFLPTINQTFYTQTYGGGLILRF